MRYSELIENTDSDDDLFGGRDRGSPTAEKAVAKFKMAFPVNKRVSWSKMHFGTVERLFDLTRDSRFTAGESVNRHSYWATSAYTNRQSGLGMLVYEESSAGTWVYLGANDRNDFARMIQQMIEAGQLEDPAAVKQRRLEKQQKRAATVEKKGIRVGTKIDIGNGITAEVIEIKPTTGKVVMKDITGNRIGTERIYSAYQISKSMIMSENNDDDDLFATPKIAFNDVFNEYDEDQLMAQGFQYGDHPEQDIEILNNYLEDYKDFRVVDISGGEHDLILHLDRSSRLRETDDDELFGTTSFNADRAGKLIATANITSGELVDPESIQHALEHAANRVMNSPVVQKKAADQLQKWMAMDNDAQWELVDEIANVVYEINGDGWEPEEDPYYDRANESADDDDELFGVSRSNAVKIGHLLAAAGVTGFDLWEPDTVEDGLKLAKKLPGQGRSADELLQLWKQLDDDDDQWNEYQIIRKIVIDINGDGLLDPEEDPYYDRANESADDDDELFGKKWHENINRRSIEIDGVDSSDYPDFADAHIVYAETQDGKPLTDEQLDQLNDMYSDSGELNELVWDSLHEDRHAL